MSTDTRFLRLWLKAMDEALEERGQEGSARSLIKLQLDKLDAGAFESAASVGPTGRQARASDPRTSKEAAALASGDFDATIRTKVLQLFVENDDLTDDEMRVLLTERGIENSTPAVRRGELVKRGFLRDTGTTRASAHGRQMTVWALNPAWRTVTGVPQP